MEMEHLLKEINEVLDASRNETLIAIAFLHGMKTALVLCGIKYEKENYDCNKDKI